MITMHTNGHTVPEITGPPPCKNGVVAGTPLDDLKRIQRQKAFTIDIDLHLGKGEAEDGRSGEHTSAEAVEDGRDRQ